MSPFKHEHAQLQPLHSHSSYNPDSDDVVHPYFTSLHATAFGLGSGTGVEGVWYVILCDVRVYQLTHQGTVIPDSLLQNCWDLE